MLEFIKPTSDEQLRQLAELADDIWREHYSSILDGQQLEYMLREYQSEQAMARQITEGLEYYVLVYDGSPVGYVAVTEDDGLFISKYYIHKDYRGLGIGRQAMDWLQALAGERQQRRLWLKCNRYNKNSLAVYGRLGFTIIGEVDGDLGQGYVAEDYILEKEL